MTPVRTCIPRPLVARLRFALRGLALLASLAILAGCEEPACRAMKDCCEAVAKEPGVGRACGPLIDGLKDAESCQGVNAAVVSMMQKKAKPVPPVCMP